MDESLELFFLLTGVYGIIKCLVFETMKRSGGIDTQSAFSLNLRLSLLYSWWRFLWRQFALQCLGYSFFRFYVFISPLTYIVPCRGLGRRDGHKFNIKSEFRVLVKEH